MKLKELKLTEMHGLSTHDAFEEMGFVTADNLSVNDDGSVNVIMDPPTFSNYSYIIAAKYDRLPRPIKDCYGGFKIQECNNLLDTKISQRILQEICA